MNRSLSGFVPDITSRATSRKNMLDTVDKVSNSAFVTTNATKLDTMLGKCKYCKTATKKSIRKKPQTPK